MDNFYNPTPTLKSSASNRLSFYRLGGAFKKNFLKGCLTFMFLIAGISAVFAHANQVGYVVLPNGFIRVYIEHWHGDQTTASLVGNGMSITTTYGTTTVTQNVNPTGAFNNTTWNNLPGAGPNIIILAKGPSANLENDWAYYDFAPAACNVPVNITLNGGLTVVLTEESANIWPQTIAGTFNDTSAPTITPANTTATVSCNTPGTNVNFSATALDNCTANPAVTFSIAPGSYFPVGTTNVTAYSTDANGNSGQLTFPVTVSVLDNVKPVLTIPSSITVNNTINTCGAAVSFAAPTATDICSTPTVVQTAGLASGSVFPVGVTTNTFKATDAAGNFITASFTVTVLDVQAPVANLAVLPDILGQCSVAGIMAPKATDNCEGLKTGTTTDPLTYTAQGTYTITWKYTDSKGNFSTQTQKVIIKDTTVPVIPVLASVSGQCSGTVGVAPTTTDNCSGTITGTTTDALTYSTQGTHPITWTFTDAAGNFSTAVQNVIVKDVIAPVVPVLANVTGQCTATALAPTTTDACAGVITGTTTDPISFTAQGTYTIHWSFNDGNGNTSTAVQTVIVNDTTSPVANIASLPVVRGECAATVTAPTATDNCAGVITATTTDATTYSAQGTHTITWTYNDGNGNTSFQNQTVVITDVTPPIPDLAALATVTGECSATVIAPTATDNCKGTITGTTTNPTTYTSQGTYTIIWKYDDGSGNSSLQAQTVIVKDVTPPTLTGPVSLALTNDPGQCGAVATYPAPTATDNCAVAATSSTFTISNGCADGTIDFSTPLTNGVTGIKFDGSGYDGIVHGHGYADLYVDLQVFSSISNTWTSVQNLHVGTGDYYYDNTSISFPAINGVTAIRFVANQYVGCAFHLNNLSASLIGGGSVSIVQTTGLPSGSMFPIGTTTNTFVATDAVGNTSTHSFDVVVTDTAKPVFAAIASQSVNTDMGVCGAKTTYLTPVATDNCSVTTAQTTGLPSGSVFPTGTTTNTFLATDASGNTETISFNVTVTDVEKPVFAAIANPSVNTDLGVCGAKVVYATPAATDNCAVTTVQTAGLPSGSIFPVGLTINKFVATDASGNRDSISFTVTVKDNEKPKFAAITSPSVNTDLGVCGAKVVYLTPKATDNCTVTTVQTAGLPSGSVFPVGTTTNTFLATDASGNTETTSFTVTVKDNEKPKFAAIASPSVNTDLGVCGAKVVYLTPKATDNCTVTTVQTAGLPSGSVFPVGTTTNTFLATDASGNTEATSFTVTVKDNEKPKFAAIASPSVNADLGVCGAKVVYATPVATDNCSVSTLQTAGLPSGSTFPVGTTTNTFLATDASGNTSTSSFTVTVTDVEKPKAIAQNITISLVNGAASITAASINNGSSDACGIKSLAVTGTTIYDCSNFGNHTVTLVVTDNNNNVSTTTAVVTVLGETTSSSIASQPTNTTFTGGNANNLYLGYGSQSTTLKATPTIISSNAPIHSYTYAWSGPSTGMLSSTSIAAPVFTPTVAGSYTFLVTITNFYGCKTTSAITICVKDIRVPGTDGKKVYVCHVPGGDLSKANTLSISVNAVDSHLGNHSGDKLGTCDQQCGTAAGNIVASSDGPSSSDGERVAVALQNTLEVSKSSLTVYPNPFASQTTVSFTLVDDETKVSLDLFGINGTRVQNVYAGSARANKAQSFSFDSSNLPSGTYFFRLTGSKANLTFKVIIVR